MLIEFSFENYRSFKNKATLSFLIPGTKEKYPGRYILEVEQGRYNISPFAALYGKNASGKSNVIKALSDFVSLILYSHRLNLDAPIPSYKPYRLDVHSRGAPVSFQAEFVIDGVRYAFHVRFDQISILEEELYFFPKGRRSLLYSRIKGNSIKFGNSFKGAQRSIEQHLRDNVLFLSMAVNLNNDRLKPVYRYFQTRYQFHLVMDSSDQVVVETTLNLLKAEEEGTSFKTILLGFLNAADISVSDVIIRKNEGIAEHLHLPIEMPQQQREEIIESLENRPVLGHQVYDGTKPVGEMTFLDLNSEESGGTIKMYELAGEVYDALQKGGILLIDEFNSGLHPQLCEYIIGLFRGKTTNPHGAQLIVVNHDTNLMAQEDIYRDELWLVDRDNYGASELYSINDFSKDAVRKGVNLEKSYLDGRFKAVPSINPAEFSINPN